MASICVSTYLDPITLHILFMSNYEYILLHRLYVIKSRVCHYNRSIHYMDFGGDSLGDDTRCREREEEHHRKKGKGIVSNGGINKNPTDSCNYILNDCYIILKNKYLFYGELHL